MPIGGGTCFGTTGFGVHRYLDRMAEEVIAAQGFVCSDGRTRWPESEPVKSIELVVGEPLEGEEIREMVDRHNYWRDRARVPRVQWSTVLAEEAQAYANTQAITGSRAHGSGSTGENLWSGPGSPTDAVDHWCEEEHLRYREAGEPRLEMKHFRLSDDEDFTHYTQVVWSETTSIGCGRARSPRGDEYWVCRYDPAGNTLGYRPYPV